MWLVASVIVVALALTGTVSPPYTLRVHGLAFDGAAEPSVEAQPTGTAVPIDPCPALIRDALGEAGCRVSWCESGWDPDATGGEGERGWFQIHPVHGWQSTYDPAGNVAAAVRISDGGANWSAWTTRSVLATGWCPNAMGPYPY